MIKHPKKVATHVESKMKLATYQWDNDHDHEIGIMATIVTPASVYELKTLL